MKRNQLRAYGIGLVLLAILAVLFHLKVRFDWTAFWHQLQSIRFGTICIGILLIHVSVSLRAVRWSLLLRPTGKKPPIRGLVGPQFIGFASVALFGSLADLVRPYLIAKRVHASLSSQIATYTIERMFDLGAAALIFLGALAFAPDRARMPHREVFTHVGVGSFLAAAVLCIFALTVRRFGEKIAVTAQQVLSCISPKFAHAVAGKIRAFRGGLNTVSSLPDLLGVLTLSLVIWGLVGLACVEVVHAFVHVEQLATLTFLQVMLLLAASIGGSLIQLPFVGWFTQIAATAGTMHAVFDVPTEPATACGALLLAVTFLCLIPAGLISAHLQRLSLRTVVQASEAVSASGDVVE